MENIYTFYKEETEHGRRWYVDLSDFPGSKAELEMVEGADEMLDLILESFGSSDTNKVSIRCELTPFEGANELIKQDVSADSDKSEIVENMGGWFYNLLVYEGIEIDLEMWLCNVMLHVFGNFPEKIYIKHV